MGTASAAQWKVRRRTTGAIRGIITHILLIVLGISFLLPFVWMISTSLKPDEQLFIFPPEWIPSQFMWSNYPDALSFFPFFKYLKNTLIICLWTLLGTTLSSAIVAYGFSRIQWPGRNFLFLILLSTMMLPYQVTMIPLFVLFKQLGWVGSFKPLIIPSFFGGAFSIFLVRQFYLTIPYELSDAARIDGCSEFRIFWQIILPLAKPALATVALFTFIGGWNDFLGPLIYLNDESKFTISLGLQQFVGVYGTEWSKLMSASVVTTVPIILLFFFGQKMFIQGISTTGLKG
ncbi:carbohydrate ABC transporter permease [Paenibacillus cymbidii]|uniref:carbohydrate ABC transporter permease n=1 Tax=Paenibacillus cymbidii TaxID=1639034 RepID=UPI0010805390|nr:carbohydrate ABC transporter permease [Paenibacillus cymbidii]